jgi:NAD(P)-dependent dehydrogenase (short-subunit alcohol dehydrogenase family)
VVVTGEASWIGEAIVRELSRSVESVHVLDIQAPKIPFRKLIKASSSPSALPSPLIPEISTIIPTH